MKNTKRKYGKNFPNLQNQDAEVLILHTVDFDSPEQKTREFVFRSESMRALYLVAQQVAGSDASILISGESGTGKELFARLIHNLSHRNEKPFVPVNCGILQGELFADKFFGHELGAFTGANKIRKGAFELAGGGTLFLDEVGEIPLTNQTDFLRVLEERCFKRMGGEKTLLFQARLVAATNRPLLDMVQSGGFRADLFYRLNVVPVYLPPLRERKEDISLLAEHILAFFKHVYHRPELHLHPEIISFFEEYPWPGNVRELRNLIERLVLLTSGTCIAVEHLPLDMLLDSSRHSFATSKAGANKQEAPTSLTLANAVQEAEIRAIVRAFKHAGGHKEKTAKLLGISSRSLRYKIAEFKLDI